MRYRHGHHLLLFSFSDFLYLYQHQFFLVVVFIVHMVIKCRLNLFFVCRLQPKPCNSLHLALSLIFNNINVRTTLKVKRFRVYLFLVSWSKTDGGCRCRNHLPHDLSDFLSVQLRLGHFIFVHSAAFICHQDRKHSYTLFGVKINQFELSCHLTRRFALTHQTLQWDRALPKMSLGLAIPNIDL